MTNAWRYTQFAIVNQFYMIATDQDLDFQRILLGFRHNYPRMNGMSNPDLTAGPCLVKDTMRELLDQGHEVLGIDNYSKYGEIEKSYQKPPEIYFSSR